MISQPRYQVPPTASRQRVLASRMLTSLSQVDHLPATIHPLDDSRESCLNPTKRTTSVRTKPTAPRATEQEPATGRKSRRPGTNARKPKASGSYQVRSRGRWIICSSRYLADRLCYSVHLSLCPTPFASHRPQAPTLKLSLLPVILYP